MRRSNIWQSRMHLGSCWKTIASSKTTNHLILLGLLYTKLKILIYLCFIENISGMVHYRFLDNPSSLPNLMNIPTLFKIIFLPLMGMRIKKRLESNGIGLHTPTEIYQMTEQDLRTVSTLLGNKKFFGGDEPCEDDCAVFGMIGQAVWGLPGSNFERLVNGNSKIKFKL